MIINSEIWRNIPLLHVYTEDMDHNTPVTLFLHGHLSAKEHNLHYAYQLVNQGVRVLLPDAKYHGERTENLSELELTLQFWDIVLQSLEELDLIVSEGIEKGLFLESNIALAGSSMGAVVTSAALTKYEWIKTAAICMGVSSLSKFASYHFQLFANKLKSIPITEDIKSSIISQLSTYDVENKESIFFEKPVVFWHGAQDEIVPIRFSEEFYESKLSNSKALYVKDEKAAHKVSRNGLLAVTSFIAQHLSK